MRYQAGLDGTSGGLMPNHRRAVDRAHPLGAFALRLRRLQADAIARAGNSEEARLLSPDKIAATSPWRTSRTAIFAALNGTRLVSTDTLCALVVAWDPRSRNAIGEWLMARDDVEQRLIEHQGGTPTRTKAIMRPAGETRGVPAAVTAFHEALRKVLDDAGRPTLAELYRRTEIPRSTLSSWFAGDAVPRYDRLQLLLLGLGVADDTGTVMRLRELHRAAVAEIDVRRGTRRGI